MKLNRHISSSTARIFRRDKQKLLLTFLSLFTGAVVLTVVLGLVGSVRTYLFSQSRELIGGDLVIQQSFPVRAAESKSLQAVFRAGGSYALRMQTAVPFTNPAKQKTLL